MSISDFRCVHACCLRLTAVLNKSPACYRVTDSSNFNMTSETMFNVYVIDANDVTPVFTSPNTLEIPETQEKGIN